jgi:CheY-like chemotaxis protein/nitrogen-specific signal transduction histidine kinase/HPt (histidine-containing phosphotransfer) domain-containing protein
MAMVSLLKVMGSLFRIAGSRRAPKAVPAESALLATMSHELRTPLAGIVGMAGLLKDTGLADRQRDYVTAIEGCAAALLTTIDDVLDFARVEAGKAALKAVPFDVRRLVAEVAGLLEPAAVRKGLRLSSQIAPGIPACLAGDPGRIRQVFTNLAANAVKFTEAGEVALTVKLLATNGDGSMIRLAVRDTGAGIPPEYQAAVFEPFTQLASDAGRGSGGAGLGLAICRSLVELMGGRLGLDSVPGQGSTFWVELCLREAAAVDAPAPADELDLAALPLAIPLRVLVVEDLEINRVVAAEMLRRLGCAVNCVGDAPAALAALEAGRHDIVLMDVRLPGQDGLTATAELRRREGGNGRHVPVIAVTASATADDAERCLQAGMDDYLAKPLRPQALRQALVRWGQARAAPVPHDTSTAATVRDDAPGLDRRLLAECCGSDPALVADVLETFLRTAPASLSAVEAAAARTAAPDLEREAHGLKGACQTIGAAAMAADCARLMTLARAGNLAGAAVMLDGLRTHWQGVRAEVSAYLETLRTR